MFWMSSDVMRKAPRQGCDHIGFSHRCFLIWADGNKTFQGLLGGAEWVRTWHFFWGGESGKKYNLDYYILGRKLPSLCCTWAKILLSPEITKKISHQASEEVESHFPVTCNPA